MRDLIMRTLGTIFIFLTGLVLLLILKFVPTSDIFARTPQIRKTRQAGLQLEFLENENLTEIYILMSEFNSSFTSLITVVNTYVLVLYGF